MKFRAFVIKVTRRWFGWPLTRKEIDRLERLRRRAYYIQNRLDNMPKNYNMDYSKGELSALCWAIESLSGKPFSTIPEKPNDASTRAE